LLSENLELNEGAKAYIGHLNASGKQCAVVSSAATWMVENILNALALRDAFQVVITQEQVTKHKPDPEAYNLALAGLGVAPEQALIFEDSNAGVMAGKASGCDVIAVRHEFNGKNDLSGAVACIDSFEEMLV
jgi:HAD superfamily hydrolase (TIGR01509 family)